MASKGSNWLSCSFMKANVQRSRMSGQRSGATSRPQKMVILLTGQVTLGTSARSRATLEVATGDRGAHCARGLANNKKAIRPGVTVAAAVAAMILTADDATAGLSRPWQDKQAA